MTREYPTLFAGKACFHDVSRNRKKYAAVDLTFRAVLVEPLVVGDLAVAVRGHRVAARLSHLKQEECVKKNCGVCGFYNLGSTYGVVV